MCQLVGKYSYWIQQIARFDWTIGLKPVQINVDIGNTIVIVCQPGTRRAEFQFSIEVLVIAYS